MKPALVFATGLALRLALIVRFPVIFGGDPMVRLRHMGQILLGHQLPLLQLIVYGIGRVTNNYLVVQCVMALIGSAAGLAFYLLACDLVTESAAFLAAMLLATNPFLVTFSIQPHQESLMLGLLFLAFHFFYRKKPGVSSLCLGLACFTRFEAWAAAPVLAVAYLAQAGTFSARRTLRGLALFGWAPAVWILFRHGLATEGSFVLDSHLSMARFVRWVYLGYITVKFTPLIVLVLSLFGIILLLRSRRQLAPEFLPLIAFLGLFLIALLFSAHGEWPDPERRIESREAHLWIAAAILSSAVAPETVPRYSIAVTIAGMLFGIWGAYRYVESEASDPHVLLSYRLAKALDASLGSHEKALVLAPRWPPHVATFYPEQARAVGGDRAYQAALQEMTEADLSPPSYQRTMIHSKLGDDRILWNPGVCTEWLAVWSDYPAPVPDPGTTRMVLRSGDLSVNISKRVCPPAGNEP